MCRKLFTTHYHNILFNYNLKYFVLALYRTWRTNVEVVYKLIFNFYYSDIFTILNFINQNKLYYVLLKLFILAVEELTSEEEEDDEDIPLVSVAGRRIPITEVVNMTDAISQMTPFEKEHYIQVYQDYFSAFGD